MKEISILIPTYNDACRELVIALLQQANEVEGLRFEILVADDGSTDERVKAENRRIMEEHHCRLFENNRNVGRAAVRNFLAGRASFGQLLFIDSDMTVIRKDFLRRYLDHQSDGIVYGGYEVKGDDDTNLRLRYERSCEEMHTVEKRAADPYRDFHTSNFMVSRKVMADHPLDERFRYYGYEDVLYGRRLKELGIEILHIDNPLGFCTFEENAAFVRKTEEGLRTLYTFQSELGDYSSLLSWVKRLRRCRLAWIPLLAYRLWGQRMKANLCGKAPSLRVFQLYKMGYFLAMDKQGLPPR